MRIGLALPQLGPHGEGHRVAGFARAAEELGYASLWVGDRALTPLVPADPYPGSPQPYPPEFTRCLDPVVTLTAAAAATTTVRLGMSTLSAPWYPPLLLARSLTSLDAVSGGRLDAGFGLGWMRDEYAAVGVPWRERGRRLEEILDVLEALWTRNPVEHHGRHYHLPRSVVDLRPVQPGGPPVLLGGYTAAAAERAGRRGAGFLVGWGMPAGYLALLWRTACEAAEKAGRDPSTLRREVRVNMRPGRPVSSLAPVLERVREWGADGVFVDLTYGTRTIDEALDVAAELIASS